MEEAEEQSSELREQASNNSDEALKLLNSKFEQEFLG